MKLSEEFESIRQWAEARGIYDKGDVKTQCLKLIEEVGELSKAIIESDKEEFTDAIGDCVVVLTNLAKLGDKYFIENCKHCHGEGSFYEDVCGDGGSRMLVDCEECGGITIESCVNDAYDVISKRQGKMENGTFVRNK